MWALLAYLLITESAPSREWLSELLFSDADDPLNALSWNLTQLRELLGPESSIGGEPVVLRLPPGTFVDVHALTAGTWMHAIGIPGLGRELLEGKSFPSWRQLRGVAAGKSQTPGRSGRRRAPRGGAGEALDG